MGLIVVIWELVQGLGALVGLATGIFVLWERLTKHSPLSYFVSEPFHGGQRYLFARVSNRSDRPIFVAVQNGMENGQMRISLNDSTRAIVTSLLSGTSTFLINGNEVRDFPLLKAPDFGEMDLDNVCTVEIQWRFAQPIIWQAWRKRTLTISKRSLLILEDKLDA